MTGEQIQGLVRHLLTTLGGFAVAAGHIDNETMLAAAGAVATIVGVVWSFMAKRKSAK